MGRRSPIFGVSGAMSISMKASWKIDPKISGAICHSASGMKRLNGELVNAPRNRMMLPAMLMSTSTSLKK